MATAMFAFCYASGQIGFGTQLPDGVLPIAKGPYEALRDWLDGVARHAYDGETLLVPGIPEAPDQMAALDALKRFTAWASTSAPTGVETLYSKHKEQRGLKRSAARP